MPDYYNKKMTFEEWADILDLRAKLVPATIEGDRKPWRCDGPCGQLMYGIEWVDGKSYPTPDTTPSGFCISKEYPHVCHVCWEMYHAIELSPSGYWQGLPDTKRKIDGLRPGGNYLAT
jgi:hypothetical protein